MASVQNIIRESSESSLDAYFRQSTANFKNDGSIVTEADIAMQEAMTSDLHKRYPEVMMLSEENSDQDQIKAMK